jgi:hypothetical protein
MATDSQGSTFVFASATYTVTSVTVTPGGDLLDESHLGLATGAGRRYQTPALKDDEISMEALGTSIVAVGTSGNLVFASTTYTAICASSSVAYAVGELVKQSLTFKVRT